MPRSAPRRRRALSKSRAATPVGRAAEILIAHASRGSVGPAWEAQAARFLAKFPDLAGGEPRPSHFYAVHFTDHGQVRAMHAEMRGLASLLRTSPVP